MAVDHKHTLTVNREAWFIRFYVWLWEASPYDINFCKLFWGLTLAPFGLVLRGVFESIAFAGRRIKRWTAKRRHRREIEALVSPPKLKVAKPSAPAGPSRMQRALGGIATGFSRLAMGAAATWDFITRHRALNRWVFRLAMTVGVLLGLAAAAVVVWLVVVNLSITLVVLASILGLVFTGLFFFSLKLLGVLDALANKVLKPTGKGLKGGTLGLAGVLAHGYIAVKSNTCPRVEVRGAQADQGGLGMAGQAGRS